VGRGGGPTDAVPLGLAPAWGDTSVVSEPVVSVIVPVWNNASGLATCLAALRGQNYPPEKLDLIVVDNGSDTALQGAEAAADILWIREPVPGSYRARNRGMEEARGMILAFTDSDCVPSPDWVSAGVRRIATMANPGFLAGAVDVVPRDPASPTLVERFEMVLAFPQESYVRRGHFGATANLFTTIDVVRSVGPFREDLLSGGDAEWGHRVHATGRQLVYAGEVRVSHPARSTFRELMRKARRVAGGTVQLMRGHIGHLAVEQAKEWLPPPALVRLILTSRHGGSAFRRAQILALLMIVRQIRFWERLRVLAGGSPVR